MCLKIEGKASNLLPYYALKLYPKPVSNHCKTQKGHELGFLTDILKFQNVNEIQKANPKTPNWKLYENPFCKKIPKRIHLACKYLSEFLFPWKS